MLTHDLRLVVVSVLVVSSGSASASAQTAAGTRGGGAPCSKKQINVI